MSKEDEKTKETKKSSKSSKSKKSKEKPENTIYVGRKPAMTYVLAVMTCFNENDAEEVRICARGRAISTAVDVAELIRHRFLKDVEIKNIVTSTEEVEKREGGGTANVSAIEIVLKR
ncbi:MAG: DNA-binding protein Alba [Asgard group archaeon]|nr:DNA-binding protein Alba [Asgard group archaeon]